MTNNLGEARDETRPRKKAYTKPEVKQVALRPEEAVLGNCKSSGGTGPGGTCNVSACRNVGS